MVCFVVFYNQKGGTNPIGKKGKVSKMLTTILGCTLLLGAVGFTIAVIVDAIIQDRRDKKEQENHPQFFKDAKALNELIKREIHYFNDNVAPLKNLIDRTLAEWDYYPEEIKNRKSADLELYRRRYQEENQVCEAMNREIERERERLREYAEKNKIRWW